MFVELVEFLRCPENHPEGHCVLSTGAMNGRDVVRGLVGCPACQREYQIDQGIVRFGSAPYLPGGSTTVGAEAVQALLGLSSPGGNVVLIGSAVLMARELIPRLEGVHLVGVNAPAQVRGGAELSLLESSAAIPLRSAMARGVVLGEEYATEPWDREAARVLLPGLRLVVMREDCEISGMERIATGKGMWVGRKDAAHHLA